MVALPQVWVQNCPGSKGTSEDLLTVLWSCTSDPPSMMKDLRPSSTNEPTRNVPFAGDELS